MSYRLSDMLQYGGREADHEYGGARAALLAKNIRDEIARENLSGLRIGYLNPWKDKAENQAFKSLEIAADRIGVRIISVTTTNEIESESLDFIIAVASTQAKMTSVPTFGCIHEPRTRFLSEEDYFTNLLSYDGFLTISSSLRAFLTDIAAGFRLNATVGTYYNTPQANPLVAPIPAIAARNKLALCYFGTNWDPRGKPLLRELSRRPYMRIYGPKDAWSYLDEGYVGGVPFDGETPQRIYAEAGAGLVLLSKDHLLDDVISNRIFEISSVGAVAICPDMPWIRENFGDSVFYFNAHGRLETIAGAIDDAMQCIRDDPEGAQKKALRAKSIFEERFCAETMLRNAVLYFKNWRETAGAARPAEQEPLIDVVVRVGSRPVEIVRRAIQSIDDQRAGRFRVIFVRFRDLDLSGIVGAHWRRIVEFTQIDVMGGQRAPTMVAGLKAVTAPYFALLDDDDFWLSHHILTLLDHAERLPEGRAFAYSGYLGVDAEAGAPDHETRRVLHCVQPSGGILDVLGRLQTGVALASSALLQKIDLDGWTLQSAEDSLLIGNLLALGEPSFTWRATACWTVDSPNSSAYVARDSRAEDVFQCFARLGPLINKIEQKFAPSAMPIQERLASALQVVFQAKSRRLLSDATKIVLEEGVACESIHDREDIEKREIALPEMLRLSGESPGLIDDRMHILPPPHSWAFGALIHFSAEEIFDGPQWVVLEFDRLFGPYGVGLLHEAGDFVTRMEAPVSELPMELWLYARRPKDLKSLVVQNWARAATEPAILRKAWIVRIAPKAGRT